MAGDGPIGIMIKRSGLATETARIKIIPQVRDEVKCPPAQVFLDQEFALLYIRTMFPYSEREVVSMLRPCDWGL